MPQPPANYKRVEPVWPGKRTQVERKDKRAVQWCRDATRLSEQSWRYVKVKEDVFRARQWRALSELAAVAAV